MVESTASPHGWHYHRQQSFELDSKCFNFSYVGHNFDTKLILILKETLLEDVQILGSILQVLSREARRCSSPGTAVDIDCRHQKISS